MKPWREKICGNCGKKFIARMRIQRFCCHKCYDAWHYEEKARPRKSARREEEEFWRKLATESREIIQSHQTNSVKKDLNT